MFKKTDYTFIISTHTQPHGVYKILSTISNYDYNSLRNNTPEKLFTKKKLYTLSTIRLNAQVPITWLVINEACNLTYFFTWPKIYTVDNWVVVVVKYSTTQQQHTVCGVYFYQKKKKKQQSKQNSQSLQDQIQRC